jgi:hypothetical protein
MRDVISPDARDVGGVARSAHLVTVRGGRVAHIKAFQTRKEALEAAGLRE